MIQPRWPARLVGSLAPSLALLLAGATLTPASAELRYVFVDNDKSASFTLDGDVSGSIRAERDAQHTQLDVLGTSFVLTTKLSGDTTALLRLARDKEGALYAKLNTETGEFHAPHNDGFDCELWVGDPAERRLRSVVHKLDAEMVRYLADDRTPPAEFMLLTSEVSTAYEVLRLACDPQAEPAAGACYYDNRDSFDGCQTCCEGANGLFSAACSTFVQTACSQVRTPGCRSAGNAACSTLRRASYTSCMQHNCTGLPGDPACLPDWPCMGFCMNFCGPGWSRACGTCPDSSNQRECCE